MRNILLVGLVGCAVPINIGSFDAGATNSDEAGTQPEADLSQQDAPFDAPMIPSTTFFLLASQQPTMPTNPTDWKGVLRFDIAKPFDPAVRKSGGGQDIDKSLVSDPSGIFFAKKTVQVWVGNRYGDTAQGSVVRFDYHQNTETFSLTMKPPISGNNANAIHQIALNPNEDRLFTATNSSALPTFKWVNGDWVPDVTLCEGGSWTRGVVVSPDGKRLYVTTAHSEIRQFDLSNNDVELAKIYPKDGNQSATNLHYMTIHCADAQCSAPVLYVGDAGNPSVSGTGGIWRFKIENNNDLTFVDRTDPGSGTFSVALSPDGDEMFAGSSYNGKQIKRYKNNNGTWTLDPQNLWIVTDTDIGTMLVFSANTPPPVCPPDCPK